MSSATTDSAVAIVGSSAGADDHPGGHGEVGGGVDEDEAAGGAVHPVLVEEERRGGVDRDPADVVDLERLDVEVAVQGVDVEPVAQHLDFGADPAGRVLELVRRPGPQRGGLVEPADRRLEAAVRGRLVGGPADHVAAGDVELVVEQHRHRHRREGLGDGAVGRVDPGDRRGLARGQDHHLVPLLEDAADDRAGVAAVVGVLGRHRPDHGLHREPVVEQVAVGGDVDVLELAEQRLPVEPGHVGRALDHVVALQGRDRHEAEVGDLQLGGEGGELLADLVVDRLVVVDQVHFVDAEHQVGHPQQRGEQGVAAGLFEHAFAGVDQQQRQVGGRGAGDHVARVLDVAGGVGDHELAPRRREVAVGDVDRDPLLALGPQAVGQQRQVGLLVAARERGLLDRGELVLEDRFGVVQEPPDQGRLAVVDRAGGGDPQQLAH